MIDLRSFSEIVATYRKHGWVPRRILTKGPLDGVAADDLRAVADVPIENSDIDAAWFSRPPANGPVIWELRSLGSVSPFALLENLDEGDPGFEDSLAEIKDRLRDGLAGKARS